MAVHKKNVFICISLEIYDSSVLYSRRAGIKLCHLMIVKAHLGKIRLKSILYRKLKF